MQSAAKKEPLSTASIKRIIERVKQYSENGMYGRLDRVHFSGGEPLSDAGQVFMLANYCREQDLKVRLFTNGDALVNDAGLLQQLYESGIDSVQIGVHNCKTIEPLSGVLGEKKQDGFRMFLDVVVTNDNHKYLSQIMQQLAEFGAESLEQKNIHVKFYDVAPLSERKDVLELVLRDSGAKDELESLYRSLFPRHTDNIQLMQQYEMNMPSLCSERKSIYVDNYGDVGFCFGVHGNSWFGNAETGDISEIVKIREILFQIISIADRYLVPYRLAKKIALETHDIDYDDWFRPYCSRVLRDLFNNHETIEELTNAFKKAHNDFWLSDPEFLLGASNRSDLLRKIGLA